MDDFPSNSRNRPITNPEKPTPPRIEEGVKLDQVVTGSVVKRKKSLGRRFMDTFFSGNSDGVLGYLLKDVLIPALQDTATRMVSEGIERAVYGEVRNHRSTVRGNGYHRPHVSYDRPSTIINRPSSIVSNRRPIQQQSADIGEIVLESKIEAQAVMDKLYETIEEYGSVSVANLNELIGQSSAYTDHRWGWTDLSQMTGKRIQGGYVLLLPSVEDLK